MPCSSAHWQCMLAMASRVAASMEGVLNWLHSTGNQQVAPPLHTMAAHQLMPLCPMPAAGNIAQGYVILLQTQLDPV